MKRTVLVTGTDQGLGLETSRQLIEKGHQVVMGALNADTAPQPEGGTVIQLDMTNAQQILDAYDFIVQLHTCTNTCSLDAALTSVSMRLECLPMI